MTIKIECAFPACDSDGSPNANGLAFFRLFYNEILDEFAKSDRWSIFNNFKEIFGAERMRKINENLTCGIKWREYLTAAFALQELFTTVVGTLQVDNVVKRKCNRIGYVIDLGSQRLYDRAHGYDIDTSSPIYRTFVKYFLRDDDPFFLDKVCISLHVYGFLDKIEQKKITYEPFFTEFNGVENGTKRRERLLQDVRLRCEAEGMDPRAYSREYDHRYFARIFLRNLPKCHKDSYENEDWIFDFVEEVQGDPYNRAMLLTFMPDYKQQLEVLYRQRMEAQQQDHGDVIEEEGEEIKVCRKQQDSGSDMFRKWQQDREMNGVASADIPLRAYQHELAESAVQGKNVVIVAPTGSGKTYVAAHIARQHLEYAERIDKPARVIFIVPKVPLVDQQQKAFKHFFGGRFLVAGMHGNAALGEDDNRKALVLGAHLTVMTPQLLINMLKSVRRADRIYMCDITMIMLDECHHTTKESAYNVLMDLLHEYPHQKPQIVGLTASLGTGGNNSSYNTEAVCDYIYKLCASMNAQKLCTVQRHKDELDRYVQLPDDEVKRCQRGDRNGPNFSTRLKATMQEMEIKLTSELKKFVNGANAIFSEREITLGNSIKCPTRYESIISQILDRIKKQNNMIPKTRTFLISSLTFLKVCANALLIDEVMPSEFAYTYLDETIKSLPETMQKVFVELVGTGRGRNSLMTLLHEECRNENIEKKEIVKELESRIRNQLHDNPNSRILIFVKERSTAQRLYECINNHSFFSALNDDGRASIAGYVTSAQSKSKKSHGQTLTDQKRMLENFNSGEIKVMVSTSVVEEGLDVQECNLIIKYNMTGTTISEMQKRGRARAAGSKSVLLAVSDSVEQREMENRHGEMLMARAILVINRLAEEEFVRRCEIHRLNRQRDKETLRAEEIRMEANTKNCYIRCITCENTLGVSGDMRTILNHNYVLCGKDIWQKVIFAPQKKIKSIGEMTLILGTANCANATDPNDPKSRCPGTLGSVIRYAGVYLVQLSIAQVQLIDKEGEVIQEKKKWAAVKKNAFYIREITTADLKRMGTCLTDSLKKAFLSAEASIKEEADQQMRKKAARRDRDEQPLRDWDPEEYDNDLDDEGIHERGDEGVDKWDDD